MSLPLPPFLRRHSIALLLVALLAGSFITYAVYAQRYIGAVDWYGYYQESLLFQQGRTTLPLELPARDFPSLVPLGFIVNADGAVVAQYPPGFPLLLALSGLVHLEFFVAPLIGTASCLLLFLLIADLTGDRWTALLYATLWACFPIVVFCATTIMSDLVAALFVLLSYFLYRRSQVFWSAFALAFALCVRPTNVFYLVIFSVLLLRDGRLVRYALYMLLPGAFYGYFNYHNYGAPWRVGYSDISGGLSAKIFVPYLEFFLRQIFLQAGLPVLLLCAWGFRRPRGEKFFFAAWGAVFLVFYSFYAGGGIDRWWWTRYLLPSFVPLFLLSALGFSHVRGLIAAWPAGPRRSAALATLFLVVGLMPVYYVGFGHYQRDLWSTNKGYAYYRAVKETEQVVPAGSYVGSVEFAGSFRLYSHVHSFLSVNDNSPKLIDYVIAQGHEAYLIVEPWNKTNGVVMELMKQYSPEKIRIIDIWGGVPVYRLHAAATP